MYRKSTEYGERYDKFNFMDREPNPDEIYRIDFTLLPVRGWQVLKIGKAGDDGRTLKTQSMYAKDFAIEDALKYLEDHGWSVRRFMFEYNGERYYPGARAFKNKMYPVRRRDSMEKMRYEIFEEIRDALSHGREAYKGAPRAGRGGPFELAYDL